MRADEIIPLLHDYYTGRLDESDRARVRAVLAEDDEARELSEVWLLLRDGLLDDRAEPNHPTSEQLVEYALGPDWRDAAAEAAVERHLSECAICRDDLERTRAAHRQAEQETVTAQARSPTRTTRRLTRLITPLAAAAVVAVLAYPAYVGLVQYPDLEERHSRLQHGVGAVPLQLLASGVRDASSSQIVMIAEDQPLLLLGVELSVPPAMSDERVVRFQALDTAGTPIELGELLAGAARNEIERTGIVTLVLPASRFEEGHYRLLVLTTDGEETKLFDASFWVERAR